MSDARQPHPLDDFQIAPDLTPEHRVPVYRPLFRLSLLLVAGSFAVLVLSAIVTSLAPPDSSVEKLSSTINRLSGLALLAACAGILLSYRIPHFSPVGKEVSARKLAQSGLARLVAGNVVGFCAVCLTLNMLTYDPWLAYWGLIAHLAVAVILISLLATVALEHKGYMRAFAIGALTAVVVMTPTFWQILAFAVTRGTAVGRIPTTALLVPIGIAQVSGLISAAYSLMLAHYRQSRADEPE